MLGPFRIHPPIHGEVVFKIDHQSRGVLGGLELGAKVGVHLERKIPEQTYQLFCLRESAFQVDDKQIVRDQAFRRDVHDRMGAILKQVSRRKHLIKVMQKLDLGSQKAPYLKKHIELLCEVMCGLGTSLGWVSSATMDKLIYVAYLHDARYFPYPALARIPNLAEFDRVKSSLTKEEQAAYLEGPAYAAELARQDSESHPDASRILLQQKELPDGSGFPGKITTQSFIPLSCLFIASHAFVDYVLEHPDWTVDDFIRSNQRVLRGQYFQKIFQAMRS
jgi:response regulator RpfG family c-di-GMP phosphodiesterase